MEEYRADNPLYGYLLYDIKLMDSRLHQKMTGVGNEEILENLIRLSKSKAAI